MYVLIVLSISGIIPLAVRYLSKNKTTHYQKVRMFILTIFDFFNLLIQVCQNCPIDFKLSMIIHLENCDKKDHMFILNMLILTFLHETTKTQKFFHYCFNLIQNPKIKVAAHLVVLKIQLRIFLFHSHIRCVKKGKINLIHTVCMHTSCICL